MFGIDELQRRIDVLVRSIERVRDDCDFTRRKLTRVMGAIREVRHTHFCYCELGEKHNWNSTSHYCEICSILLTKQEPPTDWNENMSKKRGKA